MSWFDSPIKQVIQNYAGWWVSQPSSCEYARHFDTDGKNYLFLWEGTSGKYVFDFYDWNNQAFFSEHVKGINAYFYLNIENGRIMVQLDGKVIATYSSMNMLRAATLSEWKRLKFHNPQVQKEQAEKDKSAILAALSGLGESWKASDLFLQKEPQISHKHFSTNHYKSHFFVALWLGKADDIWFGSEGFEFGVRNYDGRPRMNNRFLKFAGLEVTITGGVPAYVINRLEPGPLYLGFGKYENVEALLKDIREALPRLKFNVTP